MSVSLWHRQGRIKAGANGAAAPGPTKNRPAIVLFEFIKDNGISLKDLRGQSYDYVFNMSGKYKSMQAIIKNATTKRNIFLV